MRLVSRVERVVLGQAEARVVGLPDVPRVQELHERVALAVLGDPAARPHLQLAGAAHLQQVRPLLLDEVDADADRVHVLLPQLVALRGRGRRWSLPMAMRQRRAVGQLAPAVAVAVPVAEAVEQRPRRRRVVRRRGRRSARLVAGDGRRHRLRRAASPGPGTDRGSARRCCSAIAIARRSATLLRRVAADDRIVHVEVRVARAPAAPRGAARTPLLRVVRLSSRCRRRARCREIAAARST